MKVKIDVLFSRNEKIGSKLISWGTSHLSSFEKTPSHVALLINNRWVHESTLDTGIRVLTYEKWKEINEEVYKHEYPIEYSYDQIKAMYRDLKGRKYDWVGVLYFTWFVGMSKLFGGSIPKINKWEDPNKYFCCEVVGELARLEYSMTSPVQLLEGLKNG